MNAQTEFKPKYYTYSDGMLIPQTFILGLITLILGIAIVVGDLNNPSSVSQSQILSETIIFIIIATLWFVPTIINFLIKSRYSIKIEGESMVEIISGKRKRVFSIKSLTSIRETRYPKGFKKTLIYSLISPIAFGSLKTKCYLVTEGEQWQENPFPKYKMEKDFYMYILKIKPEVKIEVETNLPSESFRVARIFGFFLPSILPTGTEISYIASES